MYLDENRNPIVLGQQVGNAGGEGTAYEVLGNSDVVAKIYHAHCLPDQHKCEKLRYQIASRLPAISRISAWPCGLLYKDGEAEGFLMQRMPGKSIHLFYRPVDRNQFFPNATWQSLIDVARNVAAGFHCLHKHGVIMGDVNESNIFVTQTTGEVRFIDCDSFDIQGTNGQVFPCYAGTPGWMAPELLGASTQIPRRTEQHDLFGLAVMIFHLLFMGRHPFAGVPPDQHLENPPMMEELIKRAVFPYERGRRGSYKPPPNFLTLHVLPDRVAILFERAFLTRLRPTAHEWYDELKLIELKKCQWGHIFSKHLYECPWCKILNQGGTNFFVVITGVGGNGSSLPEVERLLAEVNSAIFPSLERLVSILAGKNAFTFVVPTFSSLSFPSVRATPFPAISKDRMGFVFGMFVLAACVVMLFVAPHAFFLWMMVGFFGWLFVSSGSANPAYNEEIEKRKNLPNKIASDIETILQSMQQLASNSKREFDEEKKKAIQQAASKIVAKKRDFDAKTSSLGDDLRRLKNDAQGIPNLRNTLRSEIARTAQLEAYLRNVRLPRHGIPQIGPVRYSTLVSHGIHTAWDAKTMRGVPGLGAGSGELRYWVNQIEKGFRFNSSAPLPPAAEQIIQRKVQTKEQEVLRCYESLKKRWIDLKNSAVESSNNAALSQELRGESDKLDALVEKAKVSYLAIKLKLDELVIAHAQSVANAESCPKPLKRWR